MIGFAAIEGFLHILTQFNVINEFQDIERPTDILQFPQSFLGLILSLVAGEFAYNRRLSHFFLC